MYFRRSWIMFKINPRKLHFDEKEKNSSTMSWNFQFLLFKFVQFLLFQFVKINFERHKYSNTEWKINVVEILSFSFKLNFDLHTTTWPGFWKKGINHIFFENWFLLQFCNTVIAIYLVCKYYIPISNMQQ